MAQKGIRMQAVLPAATAADLWEIAGLPYQNLPASIVMSPEGMVDAALVGLNFISTVPATTTLTARIYGRYSVGELSGWIFASHQLGGAIGSVASGWLFDRTGDYTMAFYAAGVWALLAMGMVLAIRDEPIVRSKRAGSVPVSSALGRSS